MLQQPRRDSILRIDGPARDDGVVADGVDPLSEQQRHELGAALALPRREVEELERERVREGHDEAGTATAAGGDDARAGRGGALEGGEVQLEEDGEGVGFAFADRGRHAGEEGGGGDLEDEVGAEEAGALADEFERFELRVGPGRAGQVFVGDVSGVEGAACVVDGLVALAFLVR